MSVINYIEMTKTQHNVLGVHEKSLFFLPFADHPLKLLAESRWNQPGVTTYAKYQILNLKSVLYESEMNRIWMEVNKKKKNSVSSNNTSLLVE